MGLLQRLRGKSGSSLSRQERDAELDYLRQWSHNRGGVEAFIEPATRFIGTTVILIADDGEWTRRQVAGPEAARRFAKRAGLPIYDIHVTGYPQRLRDRQERERIQRRREQRRRDSS